MAIQFFTDKIKIGDFTLYEGNGGLQFDGVARAENFKKNLLQGAVSGFTSGGATSNPGAAVTNTIDKFPFATDTNSTDYGDLTTATRVGAGQSSSTHGYQTGGFTTWTPGTPFTNTIQKFSFAVGSLSTATAVLSQTRGDSAGQSSSENGYTSGGDAPPVVNTIDKFPFATDGNATDVGDLTTVRQGSSGTSSITHGYNSGGYVPGGYTNIIDKFPFATNTNASDVGDITRATVFRTSGQSSSENGYTSGGGPSLINTIDKFPFATDTNATDVGDLTIVKQGKAGVSSTTNGYDTGGLVSSFPVGTMTNVKDKFPFATDSNALDAGDLSQTRGLSSGQQY